MFQRMIQQELIKWSQKKIRKPLIIRGARQVGKTTVVRQFSQRFRHYIYLNLELPEDRRPFENFTDVETLLQALFFIKNVAVSERSQTLLFIDEIQEVPEALGLLRYFYEQAPEIPVIAAGSMLESLFKTDTSLPVGRVEYMVLHPVSFPEFLEAMGEASSIEQLKKIPAAGFAHEKLLAFFRTYCLIGGMPEVVANYIENRDLILLSPIFESLLISYMDDVEKYADRSTQVEYIRHAIRASFAEAGKRIKFQHFGHSSYKSREMGEALRTLEKALLINLIYPQTSPVLPLIPDLGKSPRLHVLDTGMLNYFIGIQQEILGKTELDAVYHGTMIEHIVGQELLARQYSALRGLNFWVREKKTSVAEIDYLLLFAGQLIPIEVKAGASGTLRSLFTFLDEAPHNMGVRLYSGEVLISRVNSPSGKEIQLLNLPYYLVSQIDQYLDWFSASVSEKK